MRFLVYCAICGKRFYTNTHREGYWCQSCARAEKEMFERATKK